MIPIYVVLLLFVVGLGFIIAEAFVPGGVLGFLGGAAVILSIYLAFTDHGVLLGIGMTITALVVAPGTVLIALRRLSLTKTLADAQTQPLGIEHLVGMEGVTLSPLRPSGLARIDGRRLDVVSRGELLDAQTTVRVIRVEGNRIVVKAVAPLSSTSPEEPQTS